MNAQPQHRYAVKRKQATEDLTNFRTGSYVVARKMVAVTTSARFLLRCDCGDERPMMASLIRRAIKDQKPPVCRECGAGKRTQE